MSKFNSEIDNKKEDWDIVQFNLHMNEKEGIYERNQLDYELLRRFYIIKFNNPKKQTFDLLVILFAIFNSISTPVEISF